MWHHGSFTCKGYFVSNVSTSKDSMVPALGSNFMIAEPPLCRKKDPPRTTGLATENANSTLGEFRLCLVHVLSGWISK
jgi:hypothetical protein